MGLKVPWAFPALWKAAFFRYGGGAFFFLLSPHGIEMPFFLLFLPKLPFMVAHLRNGGIVILASYMRRV